MEGIFLKLVNMSVSACWLIMAAVIIRLVLKKAPKAFRFILWALIAVKLICPFSFESIYSIVPSKEIMDTQIMYSDSPQIQSGITAVDNIINPVIEKNLAPKVYDSVNPMQTVIRIAAIIWICGVVIMAAYALISYIRLRKKTSVFFWIDKNVRICDEISQPFILGIFKPVIYLPSSLNTMQIEYILAHERAHIKRRDYIWKPLGFMLLAIYWFNPLIWLAYILLCRDIELACDERVIKDMGVQDRKEYSGVLLACSIKRRTIMACPLAFGEVGVKERVKSVLNYRKPAFWLIIMCVAACIAVSVFLFTAPRTKLSDKLDKAVSEAILDSNDYSPDMNDKFKCEDHKVLAIKDKRKEVTVYMMVLSETYRQDGGNVAVDSGIHAPMAATFDKIGNDEYKLTELWLPQDGSRYVKSIRKKFPITVWHKAIDTQKYIDKQEESCRRQAEEYFLSNNTISLVNEGEDTDNSDDNTDNKTAVDGSNLVIGMNDFDFKNVKSFLSEFPDKGEELVKAGCFVISYGSVGGGIEVWNRFYGNVKSHIPCDIVIAQFTLEGDAILDYIYYNGNDFYYVRDSSRDKFGSRSERYQEERYSYMNVFDEVLENGDKSISVLLSEDEDMTYDEFSKIMASDTYGDKGIRYLNCFAYGNVNADITGNEVWHDLATVYDEKKVLQKKAAKLIVIDGGTGEKKTYSVTDSSNGYRDIMKQYKSLDIEPVKEDSIRNGYKYMLVLYDEDENILQRVIPYKDCVYIDGNVYDSSMNGTSIELLYALDENW